MHLCLQEVVFQNILKEHIEQNCSGNMFFAFALRTKKSHMTWRSMWMEQEAEILQSIIKHFFLNHPNFRSETAENCSCILRPPSREKGLQKLWQIITLEMENSQTEVFNGEKEISAKAAAVQ